MKISNWNGRPTIDASLHSFEEQFHDGITYTPRGNGRNYGDAGLNHHIVDMSGQRDVLELDETILHASAGMTLTDLLNFILPKGLLLPVIPGTQHVTVGGMIAADVHGKNHASHGAIGRWITSIELLLPDGTKHMCSPTENEELFQTTIGGMGCTGLIISAKFKLIPLKSTQYQQKTRACENLQSLLEVLQNSTSEYAAGWFDCYTMGRYLCVEHNAVSGTSSSDFQLQKPKVKIPFRSLPFVQPFVMKWYNKRHAKKTLKCDGKIVRPEDVFFPLDSISNSNYLYGKRGFYQLQFTLPPEEILPKAEQIMNAIQQSGFIPTLVVVKRHGDLDSPGILSYPTPGFSFAFDFRYQRGLEDFLRQMNRDVAAMDGRIYLVKDALLDIESFEKMYPEADDFRTSVRKFNDGRMASLLSKRLNLTP